MRGFPNPRSRRGLRDRRRAIEFISTRYRDQPSIEAVAGHVGLWASHFQHVSSAGRG